MTILDNQGNLLARGGGADDPDLLAANQYEERTAATEARIRRTVEDIVSSVVGPDKARVQVAAEIDFNRVTISAEEYDPDGQVVLSTQTIEKSSSNRETEREQAVSVGNNLPEAAQDEGPDQESSSSSSETEEIVNSQNSKTMRTEIL
ncbi:MAG: flagellar M-ring protein FliF C-terminal domain-containing protein, partial [Pseudomonadota bacterium]